MAITLTELHDKLKSLDEISLMELLEITSEDMVARFGERIRERYNELVVEFDDTPGVDASDWETIGELDYDEDE